MVFEATQEFWFEEGSTSQYAINYEELAQRLWKKYQEEVEKRIFLQNLVEEKTPKILSDELAELEIKSFLLQKKSKGVIHVDIFNIVKSLRLPPEQINRIMDRLKLHGVREVE